VKEDTEKHFFYLY